MASDIASLEGTLSYIAGQLKTLTSIASPTGYTRAATDYLMVVNSFMLELASYLSVNLLGVGISIASFGSAFMGSILVSITRSILDSIAEN